MLNGREKSPVPIGEEAEWVAGQVWTVARGLSPPLCGLRCHVPSSHLSLQTVLWANLSAVSRRVKLCAELTSVAVLRAASFTEQGEALPLLVTSFDTRVSLRSVDIMAFVSTLPLRVRMYKRMSNNKPNK